MVDFTPPTDLGAAYYAEASRIRQLAREPARWRHVAPGDPGSEPPAEQRHKLKLPSWETALLFVYTIDVVTPTDGSAKRTMRHLSVQFSVPAAVTQGLLNLEKDGVLEFLAPMVVPWFPLHSHVMAHLIAHPPVPIGDVRLPKPERNVTFRTPIVAHFVAAIDDVSLLLGTEEAR